jgi:catalase
MGTAKQEAMARDASSSSSSSTAAAAGTAATLTTSWGQPVGDTATSLKAGVRGPVLLQDAQLRDKITHFDHESIPERVVHARGAAAHGHYTAYASATEALASVTCAAFLTEPDRRTPVFVRFSTVLGARGSADTVRDIRGFATRFYTPEGNMDLVGNSIPVFFVADAAAFPDLVHAGKPEPHNDMPQAATAHNNFWDYCGWTPETVHVLMWILSDRGLPRSYRMMPGFGVNTYVLVNNEGARTLVKFHWRPLLGAHALAWDEAQKLAGRDPDYHRRDLYETIARGDAPPAWELGVQCIPSADEHAYPYDLLDDTKLVPEEDVPVRWVGRLVLTHNPSDAHAETEQVAYCVENLVRGVELSNDPVLQGRAFSYRDTQLSRLGSVNYPDLPINRPLCPVTTHHRRGFFQTRVCPGPFNYHPNRGGTTTTAPAGTSYDDGDGRVPIRDNPQEEDATVAAAAMRVRVRGPKFAEHYAQARLFFHSLTPGEQARLKQALCYELGKCDDVGVRTRAVALFHPVDAALAAAVAAAVGVTQVPAPAPVPTPAPVRLSPSLSLERSLRPVRAATRRVALLVADGCDGGHVEKLDAALRAEGAVPVLVSTQRGPVQSTTTALVAEETLWTTHSTAFDAVLVPGGAASVQTLRRMGEALAFVNEAFKHCKVLGAVGDGIILLRAASLPPLRIATDGHSPDPATVVMDHGIVTALALGDTAFFDNDNSNNDNDNDEDAAVRTADLAPSGRGLAHDVVRCLRRHRFWDRPVATVPA